MERHQFSASEIGDREILDMEPEEAIERLMDLYGEELKRLAYSYTKNWMQTDDLIQEVFLSIYQKLHTFNGKSALKSWIYSIAINKCKDYLRSWHYRKLQLTDHWMTTGKTQGNGPMENVIQQDENKKLIEAVLELPIKYREVIVLFYYKDMNIDEICQMLSLSPSAVKTRLHRGREKLRMSHSLEGGMLNG
ncbi:sigma-70 family RNA polymerase sigma factor [Falsibacillus pallidus]|uniref:RNA polymerase sigma factor n=1 Tax=Falsibacillus pallidus TaxID=493781 RepID=A0A370GTC8_9BACI|nr:sigma-70 family RNA polymerase sigma factor [Falsibacillus pallidus]RDI45784.1 RNA polymerase sigma-70 factor (ECF subfamily) [Falsibacillus pallidus]